MGKRFVCVLMLVCALGSARDARALSQNTKSLVRAGGWGLLAGTALGLAALPATRNTRGVFIGSSIGLYLGLAAGLFLLSSPETAAGLREGAADVPREHEHADLAPAAAVQSSGDLGVSVSVLSW